MVRLIVSKVPTKGMLNERLHWVTEASGREAHPDMTSWLQLYISWTNKRGIGKEVELIVLLSIYNIQFTGQQNYVSSVLC